MVTSRSDDGDVQHSSRPHTMLGPTVLNRNDMLCVTSLEVEFLSASSCNCFHTAFVVQQLIASSCRLDLRFLVNSTLLHTIPYTQDEIWTPLVSRSAILEYKFKTAPIGNKVRENLLDCIFVFINMNNALTFRNV